MDYGKKYEGRPVIRLDQHIDGEKKTMLPRPFTTKLRKHYTENHSNESLHVQQKQQKKKIEMEPLSNEQLIEFFVSAANHQAARP